jgi:transcriptional regulator with XRE-family HTH domain
MNRKALDEDDLADCRRLKSLLTEFNITQTEAADILGLTQGMVAFYARGERRITMEIAVTLCNHLDIPVSRISPRFQEMIDRSARANRRLEALWDDATEDQQNLILSLVDAVIKARPQ